MPAPAPPPGITTPDFSWHLIGTPGEIPFENGWGEWPDGNFNPPRYRKLPDGMVVFSGLIRGYGTAPGGSHAFIMPVGWRLQGQGANGEGTGRIQHRVTSQSMAMNNHNFHLYASGHISPSTTVDGWVSLCNLQYYAGL
jgi:hypothetical protein